MTGGFYATLDADSIRPYLPTIPVMLPIASWWRKDVELKRPPAIPAQVPAIAVDTGSYVLAQQFDGGYPYGFTRASIERWILDVGQRSGRTVSWAVLPDWPCEGRSPEEVRELQRRGTDTALEMLRDAPSLPWVWCPVLQGQSVDDYLRHAIEWQTYLPVLHELYRLRGQHDQFRVCVGSICRQGQAAEIRRIVEAIAEVLPDERLHLFGVKAAVLKQWYTRPAGVYSVDSATANGRIKRKGLAETNREQRQLGMTQRQYVLTVRLPRYANAINRALSAPTGRSMFE
jgi:hypothetical protein